MSKHLVFDAYGTLLKVNAVIDGLTDADAILSEKIQALWRSKQLEYTWLESLMGKYEGFNAVTNRALDYAFNYYEVENESLKTAILSIFDKPAVFEDAQTFLKELKDEELRTAILSNGETAKLRQSVSIAGIDQEIDVILSADQAQVFKPSPKVYQLACDHFSCHQEDILFFSSNPWDITGATIFGFKTVWINRRRLPFDELGVKPTFEFRSFEDFTLQDLVS